MQNKISKLESMKRIYFVPCYFCDCAKTKKNMQMLYVVYPTYNIIPSTAPALIKNMDAAGGGERRVILRHWFSTSLYSYMCYVVKL